MVYINRTAGVNFATGVTEIASEVFPSTNNDISSNNQDKDEGQNKTNNNIFSSLINKRFNSNQVKIN